MSPDGDPRTGKVENGTVTVGSGVGSTPQTALSIPSDALFVPTRVKVDYDGTTSDTLGLYDEADGTSKANASDQRDVFDVTTDTEVSESYEGPWREFENDVLVASEDDNLDDDAEVTVYGYVLTDLKDMAY